jgi:thiol-disulfide isomerase/thioredoxin
MLILDSDNKGEKLNDSDSKEPHPYLFGNTVEVYDWDGVKQEVIHLDNYAQRIMLSGDGNTLFLFAQTDEIIKPAIFSYDISNLEDNPMIDSVEIKKICKANMEKTLEKYGKKREDYLDDGDMMVDFELYDYDDKPHHLNEFLGKNKYTILEFSGYGCGPCHEARPHLEKFYKQNKGKLELVTVSVDKLSEWKRKPLGEVSWHEWNDHNLAIDIKKKYDVQGIPTFIIINSEGKIVKKLEGFGEGRIEEMKEIISKKK